MSSGELPRPCSRMAVRRASVVGMPYCSTRCPACGSVAEPISVGRVFDMRLGRHVWSASSQARKLSLQVVAVRLEPRR